jgi:hypothetical protein
MSRATATHRRPPLVLTPELRTMLACLLSLAILAGIIAFGIFDGEQIANSAYGPGAASVKGALSVANGNVPDLARSPLFSSASDDSLRLLRSLALVYRQAHR